MSDRMARIELVQIQTRRLQVEGQRCNDLERLRVINAELEVLRDSMLKIREEQLLEQIVESEPKPEPKRRGWRFW